MWPSNGSLFRHCLPSTGSDWSRSPASTVLCSAPTPRRPSRPARCLAARYPRCGRIRSICRCHPGRWPGDVAGGLTQPRSSRETTGPPRFLSHPTAYMPCSSTPAGRPTPRRNGVCRAAFRCLENVGSRDAVITGLHHTACTLAVYASQCRLPVHHARLASDCWLRFVGWG